jgi:hypothetical protein
VAWKLRKSLITNDPHVCLPWSGTSYLFEGQFPVGGGAEPPPPQWLQSQNMLTSLIREQVQQMATREELGSTEDGNEGEGREGQERTVQQLTEELQNIMETVNSRLAGENMVLNDEFDGLEEAIQATLQVVNLLFLTSLIIIC